jgi:steroid delta-isomerase-like uncharacterized protein
MPNAKLIDIVKSQLASFANSDWASYRKTIVDDVVYEEEGTAREVTGADEYMKMLKEWKIAFPDAKAVIKEMIATGDAVVVEVEWQATHKGAFPGGRIPASNRSVKVPAVLVARFDGERARSVHHYFDLVTLLRQIGVQLPQMQPTP